MKKFYSLFFIVLTALLLSACGKSAKMTDYIEVSFSGMDTKGTASFNVDEERLYKDLFKFDPETDFPDEELLSEIEKIHKATKISLDKSEDLANGDKVTVTVTVNEKVTKKVKGGEKVFTVEGLEEPEILTSKDVEESLVVDFLGASGRGIARINNQLAAPLNTISFSVEHNGELKNGDKARLVLDETNEKKLIDKGYIVEKDFAPTFEVKGLDIVAAKATDIKNLKDIERMILEEIKRDYKDSGPNSIFKRRYEIKEEALLYRQFNNEKAEASNHYNPRTDRHGYLVGIFSIKRHDERENKIDQEFTVIYGYKNIILNEDGKTNVANMELFSERKDDTYSVETILQLYEGEGYEKVEKK